MPDMLKDALAIFAACLLIAGAATVLVMFRPSARRRHRRQTRHKGGARRPKIDLFDHERAEPTTPPDA